MFAVCVAAAIGPSKTNLLLQFEQPPSATQVMSRSIAAFTALLEERGVYNKFFVNCAMVFDDGSSRWVPLERSSQLVHNCQVYLFQPDVPDVAGPIPDPIPASTFLVAYRSPERRQHHSQSQQQQPVSYAGHDEFYMKHPSETAPNRSPRGVMPADPDLSRFTSRPAPPSATAASTSPYYGTPSQQQQVGGYHYNNNGGGGGGDDVLSPEQREILRREAEKQGAPFISGGSILREEREKEDRKVLLEVDKHRQTVRDETKKFAHDVSPDRNRN